MTKDTKTQQKAIFLLREFPDEFAAASLIENVGDQESIALGCQIMNSATTEMGWFVAAALLKTILSQIGLPLNCGCALVGMSEICLIGCNG